MVWLEFQFDISHQSLLYLCYHIVRVCVSSKVPFNPNLPVTKKSYLQVKFGSKAMASLYDILCYHFFTSTDPLLEEQLF